MKIIWEMLKKDSETESVIEGCPEAICSDSEIRNICEDLVTYDP